MQVDIIGGGLSGIATALSIKTINPSINVIIHEKHNKIGSNPDGRKCGEAHTIEPFSQKWKPPPKTIATSIYHAEIIIGDKIHIYDRKPETAWILNRPLFIKYLGDMAKKIGVEFALNDKINDISSLSGKIIVDASGCPSIVKRQIGVHHRFVGFGFQQTIENCSVYKKNTIQIIFDKMNGYYWLFPKNDERRILNIGVGCDNSNIKLSSLLDQFKKRYNISGKIRYETSGLIPGGLQYPLKYKNIIFVGDAGVGTFPFNGQGIYRALMSGDIAGYYVANNDINGYVKQILKYFIKMDLIGKSLLYWLKIIKKINQNLILDSLNLYHSLNDKITLSESEYNAKKTKKINRMDFL